MPLGDSRPPRAIRGTRISLQAGAIQPIRHAGHPGLLTPVSHTGEFQAGDQFCGPVMGGERSCKPHAALDAERLLVVVGAGREVHLKRTQLGAAWLSPCRWAPWWRRWTGTQLARRGSLGVKAPGVMKNPGPPQAWGVPRECALGQEHLDSSLHLSPIARAFFSFLKPE